MLKAKRADAAFGDAPYGIGKVADDLEDDDELRKWESFDWTKKVGPFHAQSDRGLHTQFANFTRRFRKGSSGPVGGTHYVLVNLKSKPGGRARGKSSRGPMIILGPGENIEDFL